MKARELREHKKARKVLRTIPVFKSFRRGALPPPLHRMGGPRTESTGLIKVSDSHWVHFLAHNGQTLLDRSFFAHLFVKLADDSFSPLFEFHWHPSHKGFHCKTPCRNTVNYKNRLLPHAIELNLKTQTDLDPWRPEDRLKLVNIVCNVCGIHFNTLPSGPQKDFWP